ncbi:DUF533 domain-containing protein [Frigidibacter albus]|uniref:DUF533 domain-containing protein n=1 Tax=Frigidibacter albus TaxID=1465486 RepID=A0A6L8VEG5_9RHOB|nr:DUF533 domain-containing protein [Frigidibacter albus]MZQ87972.1 DUF533 domain-containing protein [Frigidibacter albus]NBE29878.1 DUF533 domain-containing protein [Frigidibacter albus]GGH42223.1 hypothetical protein GCM10011341_00030 [Frigidibacter albus]
MSLVKTLARVALGVVAYKGIKNAMKPGPDGNQSGFGGMLDRVSRPREGSVLDKVIGNFGGGQSGGQSGGQGGGLGGMLAGGGIGGMLGGILSGAGLGNADEPQHSPAPGQPGFVDKLREAESRNGEPVVPPTPQEEAAAALMLRSMIQAAKADGEMDPEERRKILGNMENATPSDLDFLIAEMAAPVNPEALAAETPDGMQREVYAAALMAIDLDHPAQRAHLARLGAALNLTAADMAEIEGQALPMA